MDTGDGPRQVDLTEILFHYFRIETLAGYAAALAQMLGRRMRVGTGKRLVRKPRVCNEPTRTGRAHDVTAPECVDAKDGVGNISSSLVHQLSFWRFMAPNQT